LLTDLRLAEKVAVVGHDGEVEGAAQLDAGTGPAFGIVGLHADGLAEGEPVGLARARQRALPPGVEGEARVDVGVSEERAAQGVVPGAGLARLGAGQSLAGHRCDREQSDQRSQHRPPQRSSPRRFAVGARPKPVS
jgi:hypothetical protein